MNNKGYIIFISLILLLLVVIFYPNTEEREVSDSLNNPADTIFFELPDSTSIDADSVSFGPAIDAETTNILPPTVAIPTISDPPTDTAGDTNEPVPQSFPINDDDKRTAIINLKGNMAYYVPDSMEVNKSSRVSLTISKNVPLSDLKESIEKSIAHESNADTSRIVLERIKISKVMTANLYAMDSTTFRISRLSRAQQYVYLSDKDITETKWEWSVIPLKAGDHNMIIKVSTKIFDGDIEEWLEFQAYNGVVLVKAVPVPIPDPPTVFEAIINYWKGNFEWIVPALTVIGGFIAWLLSTFGKKKQDQEKDKEKKKTALKQLQRKFEN